MTEYVHRLFLLHCSVGCSVHMVVRGKGGREQEKQTGPCLRAELGEGENSTQRRDGISGPSAFMLPCLLLLAGLVARRIPVCLPV